MVQTRRKDEASFSGGTYLRRSTRERAERSVIRFEDSDKDDEDLEPEPTWQSRVRRHPKRSRRASIQYNTSLSRRSRTVCDDSESGEESNSDDSIFRTSRRSRSSRTARRVARTERLHSGDHAETSNDHIDMGLADELAQQEEDGVRRSSRRRSHPPSWLVGDQTVRGYPNYNQNAKESPEKANLVRASRSRDHLNTDHNASQRDTPLSLRSQKLAVKQEKKEDEDGEEEDETQPKETVEAEGETAEGEAAVEENGNVSTAEEDDGVKETTRRTRRRGAKDSSHHDENFPDMYSRVKRVRRQTSRFSHPDNRSRPGKFSARDGGMTSQTQSSSGSDESDSEQGEPSRRSSVRQSTRRTYQLRVNKPTIDRFQAEPVQRPQRSFQKVLSKTILRHLGRRPKSRFAPDSSSSSDGEQARYDKKKPHSRHLPHNYHPKDSVKVGGPMHTKDGRPATLADIDPMALDTSIRFKDVGGLEEHIHCLQEMVVFPMLYKDVFEKFHITPPKGVLFHGPPGTGKTLMARALANECSQGDRKVSFFMRKGADCLCKWVGESERQLRLLFEQAYQMKPSIIFFDEIDGLAPVRSSKQDQIHASIVSTLLALMDGLDNRGDVIVIGATNRVDAIDPALRRPGRFDRELYFPLPACKERQEILRIHVSKWNSKPEDSVLNKLAEQSSGYCGSDLRALCSESVIQALRRTYPQIYKSNQRLLLDSNKVQVGCEDFAIARSNIVPAAHRISPSPAHKLPTFLEPLLIRQLEKVMVQLKEVFPHGASRDKNILHTVHRPRLLILGSSQEQAQTTHLAPALLHRIEHIPVFTLDLGTMYEVSARSPEETVSQVFQEARRNPPSVVYLPGLGQWWDLVPHTVQSVFLMHLQKLDMNSPVLILATSDAELKELPSELCTIFSGYRDELFTITNPSDKEREHFFSSLLLEKPLLPPSPPKPTEDTWEELPVAPPPEPAKLTEDELKKLYAREEHTLRELRIFLREVCAKLARNRLFFMFTKPVDVEEAPDYYDIIEKPMDLESMMTRIDQHHYVCAKDFLDDIDLICRNALEYNPDRDQADKLIRHRACFLRDTAYALIKAEMDTDFEDRCQAISADRKKRKGSPSRYAPAPEFIHTASSPCVKVQAANGNKEEISRVNGDLSSHSSVASHNGAPPSGRKRRPSSWSRGFIKSKTKKKKIEDPTSEKQDANAAEAETQEGTTHSPPGSPVNRSQTPTDEVSKEGGDLEPADKCEKEKTNFSGMNGSCDNTHSDVEMNSIGSPEVKRSEGGRTRDSKSPLRLERRCSSDINKHRGKSTSPAKTMKDEISIDSTELGKLVTLAVATTGDCTVEKLTELYVRIDKVISSYKNQWDRTSLPKAVRDELHRFKTHLRPT